MGRLSTEANDLSDVPEGGGVLVELNHTGDTRTVWNPDNAEEVAAVRATFDSLRRKGFQAFSVGRDGEKDRVLTEFDPRAGKIIMAPAVAGGSGVPTLA